MNMHATPETYVFRPPAVPTLPVRGTTKLFPVHRIYCVGRNFADHAIEMGHDPTASRRSSSRRTPTRWFSRGRISPTRRVEGRAPRDRTRRRAVQGRHRHPAGPGDGPRLRLCRRPRHDAARPSGRGQEDGPPLGDRKGVRGIGALHRARAGRRGSRRHRGSVELRINGEMRQSGDLNQMIWKIPR